ncbi:hypothetical protein NHX12_005793 [Muraenolepis orangiensis]|uniref:Transmembrane protein n=1 Tax=Muraenolepis orangiensis TaxID=630683 RepID=A0A9Q0ID87_9TELE|nr:hypothetical protein NHX12_005793 [Muraenolepis orangiensis]
MSAKIVDSELRMESGVGAEQHAASSQKEQTAFVGIRKFQRFNATVLGAIEVTIGILMTLTAIMYVAIDVDVVITALIYWGIIFVRGTLGMNVMAALSSVGGSVLHFFGGLLFVFPPCGRSCHILRNTEIVMLVLSIMLFIISILLAAFATAALCSSRKNRPMSVEFPCLSFRQPYAGLVLSGLKSVESRWSSVLSGLEDRTLAVHVARRDWEEGGWASLLASQGWDGAPLRALLEDGERFGRGVVAGLVEVGVTWRCPASLPEEDLHELEKAAILIGLQDKYLTRLSNPRWLVEPLPCRGNKDLWTVEIPSHLLPNPSA